MPLVDVKIEVPEGYELTDNEPVNLNPGDSFLGVVSGEVRLWQSSHPSRKKYFRVRKIPQPPKVEVRLKPGWLVKDCRGVFWFDNKPNLGSHGVYIARNAVYFECLPEMVSIEFPEGVTLMEVV